MGGWVIKQGMQIYKTVEQNHLEKDKWDQVADLNVARSDASSICHGDFIYIFCGRTNGNIFLNSFERMSVNGLESGDGAWKMMPTPAPNLLSRRISPAIASYNDNEIALIRGYGSQDFSLESLYDTTRNYWRLIFENDPVLNSVNSGFETKYQCA